MKWEQHIITQLQLQLCNQVVIHENAKLSVSARLLWMTIWINECKCFYNQSDLKDFCFDQIYRTNKIPNKIVREPSIEDVYRRVSAI